MKFNPKDFTDKKPRPPVGKIHLDLPVDLHERFQALLEKSGLTKTALIEAMVRFALKANEDVSL